jgi:hypothetical protein
LKDIKANKEKAAEKIDDNVSPKLFGFLGTVHKAWSVAVRLERFAGERGGYH